MSGSAVTDVTSRGNMLSSHHGAPLLPYHLDDEGPVCVKSANIAGVIDVTQYIK